MNIFYLDSDPYRAASFLCDKHIGKMLMESAQLLSTAHRILDGHKYADKHTLYKPTHKNHPCAVWVRESKANYMWLWNHMRGCSMEFAKRYRKGHATAKLLQALSNPPKNIPNVGPTEPALAMPEIYRSKFPVMAYRHYYQEEKYDIAYWKHGPKPFWWRK